MSGRTDNVIYYSGGYISYVLYMTYVHITCQAELILSYITCKVYMISGNERLRFSPPLMKYIILPDTKYLTGIFANFFIFITIFRSQLHIFFSGLYKKIFVVVKS